MSFFDRPSLEVRVTIEQSSAVEIQLPFQEVDVAPGKLNTGLV